MHLQNGREYTPIGAQWHLQIGRDYTLLGAQRHLQSGTDYTLLGAQWHLQSGRDYTLLMAVIAPCVARKGTARVVEVTPYIVSCWVPLCPLFSV